MRTSERNYALALIFRAHRIFNATKPSSYAQNFIPEIYICIIHNINEDILIASTKTYNYIIIDFDTNCIELVDIDKQHNL